MTGSKGIERNPVPSGTVQGHLGRDVEYASRTSCSTLHRSAVVVHLIGVVTHVLTCEIPVQTCCIGHGRGGTGLAIRCCGEGNRHEILIEVVTHKVCERHERCVQFGQRQLSWIAEADRCRNIDGEDGTDRRVGIGGNSDIQPSRAGYNIGGGDSSRAGHTDRSCPALVRGISRQHRYRHQFVYFREIIVANLCYDGCRAEVNGGNVDNGFADDNLCRGCCGILLHGY